MNSIQSEKVHRLGIGIRIAFKRYYEYQIENEDLNIMTHSTAIFAHRF
jgi:hypothetical protein